MTLSDKTQSIVEVDANSFVVELAGVFRQICSAYFYDLGSISTKSIFSTLEYRVSSFYYAAVACSNDQYIANIGMN